MSFALFSALFYIISILFIAPMLAKAQSGEQIQHPNKNWFILTALFAVICHFISLFPFFSNLFSGENFTLMEIGSLISVLIAILATVAIALKIKTFWFLLPIIYCFATINVTLAAFAPSHVIQNLAQDLGLLLHILLAMFAYAVCFIAMLQSIQLAWLDRKLKTKQMVISPLLPPLMMVERHFFRVMLSGEILLTLTLLTGAVYLADFFGNENIQKAIFSFLAWIVYAVLLIGHWKYRWRGKKMIIYTISGMILLTIAYFGSRAMLGMN